jgi:hypothetical protein
VFLCFDVQLQLDIVSLDLSSPLATSKYTIGIGERIVVNFPKLVYLNLQGAHIKTKDMHALKSTKLVFGITDVCKS